MRALSWIVVAAAVLIGLLFVAIAVGAVWLNSFIRSPEFLTEVETRAGQSLGGPVQIKSIDFDIFHGIKLQGLVTQIDLSRTGGKGTLQANIATVNCSYSWVELFHRQLELTGVTLDQPQFVLSQQPIAPPPVPSTAENASAPSGPVSDAGAAAGAGAAAVFQFVLDRAQLDNGSFSLIDAHGQKSVDLQGIYVGAKTADYVSNQSASGIINIATASFPPGVQLTNFCTPFTYHTGVLSAQPLSGSVFNGNLSGDYTLGGGAGNPSILDLNGKGLDIPKLLTALSPTSSTAMVTGSLDIQSKWRGVEVGTVDGEGDLQVTGGQLHGVKILNEIGSLLKIKELTDPVIKQGQTHFQVANDQTQLTSLQLVSNGFSITGGGTVGFDGRLNLNLVLVLSQGAMGRMPKQLSSSFVTQADGTGTIGFNVTGTTSDPQTDLPQRLLLQNTQIKNVINKALNKFFH